MKRLIATTLLTSGPLALAEPCKQHRDLVNANFKKQDWKLVSYATDDYLMSTTFRKEVKEGSILMNFLYTTNKLLILEAEMKGFETLPITCTMKSGEATILARETKEIKS